MRRTLNLFILMAVALAFGSGCFSYSTLHTAKPVEQGQTEMTLAPGYWGLGIETEGDVGGTGDIPTFEFAARHGLTPEMDVGVKAYTFGVAADLNYAVVNTPDFALSVNPYLSGSRLSSGESSFTWGTALLNVLADVVSNEMMTLTLGLKPGFLYAFGSGDLGTGNAAVVGGTALVKIKLTDSFALMPNFDFITPVDALGDVVFYNFGVAASF